MHIFTVLCKHLEPLVISLHFASKKPDFFLILVKVVLSTRLSDGISNF